MFALRIIFAVLFLLAGIVLVERQSIPLPQMFHSSKQDSSISNRPFQGPFSKYLQSNKSQPIGWMDYLSFDKKVDTFVFTYYNWYRFEVELVDLGYDSFITMHIFSHDFLKESFTEHIGFTLSEEFHSKPLQIDLQRKGLKLSISQKMLKGLNETRHDGYIYGRPWFFTRDRPLPQNSIYHGDLTVTTLQISYRSKKLEVSANLTHVTRQDDCVTFTSDSGTLRHKCFGGYGRGRVLLDSESKQRPGSTVKSMYNLENNRTRTIFEGMRSTRSLSAARREFPMRTQWNWREFKVSMICFSKPEYYEKEENIQKERTVGLYLGRVADSSTNLDYLILNGGIYPLNNTIYNFSMNPPINKNISFKSAPTQSPAFNMNFNVLFVESEKKEQWLQRREVQRVFGLWSGWAEDLKDSNSRVEFFNITGVIESSQGFY